VSLRVHKNESDIAISALSRPQVLPILLFFVKTQVPSNQLVSMSICMHKLESTDKASVTY
jgi:hypothetical protein